MSFITPSTASPVPSIEAPRQPRGMQRIYLVLVIALLVLPLPLTAPRAGAATPGAQGVATGRSSAARLLPRQGTLARAIPILRSSALIGGTRDDAATAVAIDRAGNIYVAGVTTSNNIPLANPEQRRNRGGSGSQDAFIAKLDPTGRRLLYATYLGGSTDDAAQGIAVDAAGDAYVVGYTESTDFPVLHALYAGRGGAASHRSRDAFVAKLNPAGRLVFSTYLGGSFNDEANAVTLDGHGHVVVVGSTASFNFPSRRAFQPACVSCARRHVLRDAFVTLLSTDGQRLISSTFLGGNGDDQALAVATASAGDIFVTGVTGSLDFPGARVLAGTPGGDTDAFVVRLRAGGGGLVYSVLLGGTDRDEGRAIAVDAARNAYVAGYTTSLDFPTTAGSAQPRYAGGERDAFVTKIDAAGRRVVYSTLLGGSGDDVANAIAVDNAGSVWVAGKTASLDFPTSQAAFGRAFGGGAHDAFVAAVDPAGHALRYGSLVDGDDEDAAFALAIAPTGTVYAVGTTASRAFALRPGLSRGRLGNGNANAYVLALAPAATPLIDGYLPNSAAPSSVRGAILVDQTHHSVAPAFAAFYRAHGDVLGFPATEAYRDAGGILVQDFEHMRLQQGGNSITIANLGSIVAAAQKGYDPLLVATSQPVPPAFDTPSRRYFRDTGHVVSGQILAYWRAHGGIAVFGQPISEALRETNGDGSGRAYVLQWFQKARIELHPENSDPQFSVLLGLIGLESVRQRGWAL